MEELIRSTVGKINRPSYRNFFQVLFSVFFFDSSSQMMRNPLQFYFLLFCHGSFFSPSRSLLSLTLSISQWSLPSLSPLHTNTYVAESYKLPIFSFPPACSSFMNRRPGYFTIRAPTIFLYTHIHTRRPCHCYGLNNTMYTRGTCDYTMSYEDERIYRLRGFVRT